MNTTADVMARLDLVLGDTVNEARAQGYPARLVATEPTVWGVDETIPFADRLYGWTEPAVIDDAIAVRYCPELLATTLVPDHPTTDLLIHFLSSLTALIVEAIATHPDLDADVAAYLGVSRALDALDDVGESGESGVYLLYRHQHQVFTSYTTEDDPS